MLVKIFLRISRVARARTSQPIYAKTNKMNLKYIAIAAVNRFLSDNRGIKNELLKPAVLRSMEAIIEDACMKTIKLKDLEAARSDPNQTEAIGAEI